MQAITPSIRLLTYQESMETGLQIKTLILEYNNNNYHLFQTACLSNAAALLLIHNHPTSDPTPSSEDLAITRRLKEAGEIMGIKVLDHIIVGDGQYLSFVERGLL